jgi:uroporphyrin-III C-methyltransferase/precorrin-2 dehydrogenase/sirohydrochlorin ferrochelatase
MRYFPVFFDLHDQPVLVVGGGAVAERKIRMLLEAGARPAVVAPRLRRGIREWVAEGRVEHRAPAFDPEQLAGQRLVFAATGDGALNRSVYRAAEDRQVAVNVVDDRAASRFISPAVIDRGLVQVAISTGGASPVLARRLRALIERVLPAGIGVVATAALALRSHVQRVLPAAQRRRFWESMLAEHDLVRMSGRGENRLRAELTRALGRFSRGDSGPSVGPVYLVGAGPGNPDLLTLRARQVLGQADVVLHDRLVSAEVLDRVRRDADRIEVGKRGGGDQFSQDEIHHLMIGEARKGRTVVRLKGGDPFVFGRGGEELEALARGGVVAEVVPGITAAIGCAAAAGVPLTHRHLSHQLTLLSGHSAADAAPGGARVDWARVAGPGRTLVVYMGARQAGRLTAEMLEAGVSRDLPVSLIVDGTRPRQRVIGGTVGDLAQLAAAVPGGAASLMIIGQVAGFGRNLSAFLETLAARAAA